MQTFSWVMSKLLWSILTPSVLLWGILVTASVLLYTRWHTLARRLIAAVTVIVVICGTLPVADWFYLPLENRFHVPNLEESPSIDGILVLAGAEDVDVTIARQQPSLGDAAERLTTFVALARRYPSARLVFAGGRGGLVGGVGGPPDTMRLLATELGLSPSRIHVESTSRNTFENVLRSRELAQPRPHSHWLLVTSAFHMPRAVGICRHLDWPVTPYPVDYQTDGAWRIRLCWQGFDGITAVAKPMREWTGLVAYWVMRRTSALFPKPAPRSDGGTG